MSDTEQNARYAVGIDLGTTHCVLSYVELGAEEGTPPEIVTIPQLTQPGAVEAQTQLPSFIYQPHDQELNSADLALPWSENPASLVGELARNLGSKTPMRLVSSAKSWLCNAGIDRHEAFLPLNSPEEVVKVSPLGASITFLEHLREAWNHRFPDAPLKDQEVILTVPASFDPGARELTAEAARVAGIQHLTLLEEPQAAVYSWLQTCGDDWRQQVTVGDIILVVDIGGGTTDLSLIAVSESDGNLVLDRIAVGEHILLGGDNMDLALAYRIKAKLAQEGKSLQPWQILGITHGCREAKEQLLADPTLDAVPVVVPSRGSKLIGGTLSTELTRSEVTETLIEGFFPLVDIDAHPAHQSRGALNQLGLPYAKDPAMSRHLAAFLSRQKGAADELLGPSEGSFIQPSAILLNGGVFKAPQLSERTLALINHWLNAAGAENARLLQGIDLDLAVARGAAYYGQVRQGQGVRIRGGTASAYYIGIESSMPAIPGIEAPLEALCIAPFGMEEGTEVALQDSEFGLVVGETVRFNFFASTTRRDDEAGSQLDYWEPEELDELPEIQTHLSTEGRKSGDVVPVRLVSRITEVGTLCLEAVTLDGSQRWQVELNVREA
ncbi:Hsp70 family protein [Neptunomonas qingdaonensis]|uniref:Molecular chaperone DnaK (HSP70) n=1 Tax=Neptunomonas qingdaonensis TaxID=1045558 RepID=A0A1I2V4B3_9GAMM|nr:Hsp70 family protein [Neptunomonas qingdaonensis]SFG83873.1 Molecular chaperone DnaK (HSP70) [Neptunomonas qingdaonensis]